MKSRSVILAAIGFALIVLAIGITANSGNETSENKIRVGFFPNIGHAIPIIGLETGLFEENLGNHTSIEPMIFESGPQVIEALYSKSIDIAYVGPGPAVNGFLKSENHEVVILSGAASGGASFIVHPKSEIVSASDFSGKRIAAPPIGNSQDVSLRNFLNEHGLKPYEKGGTVIVLNISTPEIYTLFAKSDIDGAWVPEPWATILVKDLGGKRLFFEEDLWQEKRFASVLLIGRQEYLEANPEIVEKWLESHKKSAEFINNNPLETRDIFIKFIKNHMGKTLSEKIIDEALSNLEITTDPIEESIYIFAKRADSLGYLGRSGYNLEGIFFDINSNESIGKGN